MNRMVLLILFFIVPWILWANGEAESNTSNGAAADSAVTVKGDSPLVDSGNLQLIDLINKGDVQAVEEKFKLDIDLEYKDDDGLTALHAAGQIGHVELTKQLLMHGVAVDPVDNGGKTPLHYAVENQHGEVISLLVESGADIRLEDGNGLTPAILSLDKSAGIIANLFNEKTVNTRFASGNTLLHLASKQGLVSHVQALIEENASTELRNDLGETALDYSLSGNLSDGIVACAAMLLRHGSPEPREDNWRYITEPIRTGDYELRFELGATAQHLAAERNHEYMLAFFVRDGANVDSRDKHGNTPLHLAIRKGYKTVSSLLISHGANVNSRDYSGNTPIHQALSMPNGSELAELLIEKGGRSQYKE